MRVGVSLWFTGGVIAMQLLTAGCGGGGGGGLGSLFEGLFGGGDSGAVFDVGDAGGGATETLTLASDVTTVHHPEPASVALFGIGVAGMAHARRRQSKRSKEATH